MKSSHWRFSTQLSQGDYRLSVTMEGRHRVTALIGPNGSGKTTILRAMAGMTKNACIEFELQGATIESTATQTTTPIHERRIGYMPQGYGLFPSMTARQNVAFGLDARYPKLPRAQRTDRVTELLRAVDCEQQAARAVQRLSGGEKQRVALARALAIEPQLLLLDEPMAAMDVASRTSIRLVLKQMIDTANCPTLLVSHDLRDVAALADYVYVLENGAITQAGRLDELARQPCSAFIAEFCQSPVL